MIEMLIFLVVSITIIVALVVLNVETQPPRTRPYLGTPVDRQYEIRRKFEEECG